MDHPSRKARSTTEQVIDLRGSAAEQHSGFVDAFQEADLKAQNTLGEAPLRPKTWVADYFWRGFDEASRLGWFTSACKQQETCLNTVRAYFVATLRDSNRQGKDVWTGVETIATRMGCSVRTVHRARSVARRLGFEQGVLRRWIDPRTSGWCSASSRIRFLVPDELSEVVLQSKIGAAKRRKLVKPPLPEMPARADKIPTPAKSGPKPPPHEEFPPLPSFDPSGAEKAKSKRLMQLSKRLLNPG